MTYCGIDEAGLGPILGPLSAARCTVDFTPKEFWQLLQQTAIWPLAKKNAVADSKQIFRKSTDLAKLEQIALSIYLAASPDKLAEFSAKGLASKALFDEGEQRQMTELPWYRQILESSLPLCASRTETWHGARRLADKLEKLGKNVSLHGELFCEKLYNQKISQLDNKSLVLRELIGSLILDFVCKRGGLQCFVDRLGGLKYYQTWLEHLLPDSSVTILSEGPDCSAYQVSGDFQIHFLVKGDQQNILCAVASVWAKYRRELLMYAFNQYWGSELPKTSGYYRDATVFLQKLQDLRGELPQNLRRSR